MKKDKNYFELVEEMENESKIEYRKWMKSIDCEPHKMGEHAYVHGTITAKLATALREIDNLKMQIK